MQKNSPLLNKEFKALAEENRLKILLFIHEHQLKCAYDEDGTKRCDLQCCIKDIANHFELSLSTISYHIKELVNANIITIKKEGKWSHCKINKDKIEIFLNFFNTLR